LQDEPAGDAEEDDHAGDNDELESSEEVDGGDEVKAEIVEAEDEVRLSR
jgi:hypothetical protein